MKKNLLALAIIILMICSCQNKEKESTTDVEKPQTIADTSSPAVKSDITNDAKPDDDLILLLFFSIKDPDFKDFNYKYVYKANGITKEYSINNPITSKYVPPSFIYLNLGARNALPSGNQLKFDFKIKRYKIGGEPDEFEQIMTYKGVFNYGDYKFLNAKVVPQEVFIDFGNGGTRPLEINPPIKPGPG